jgi:hypothetical protein
MTVLEVAGAFRRLKKRGLVEENDGLLKLWPLE